MLASHGDFPERALGTMRVDPMKPRVRSTRNVYECINRTVFDFNCLPTTAHVALS